MNWRPFLESTDVKVLLYLLQHGNARYSDLLRATGKTRGALANSLHDLKKRKLLDREVVNSMPVQTKYALTDKGLKMAQLVAEMQKLA